MDIIQTLIGEHEGWDQVDTLDFVMYDVKKFNGATVNLSLSQMKVEVLSGNGEQVVATYPISAKLGPIECAK